MTIEAWNYGYDKSLKKARKLYKSIGSIPCPALNDELIAFNNEGFNHLVRKGRIPRPHNEQKRRFCLIPYIEEIIKNPASTMVFNRREEKYYVNRHGTQVLITSEVSYWRFYTKIDGCTIKVVIRQRDGGNKTFFSVMGEEIKIQRYKKARKTRA
jgi:hypothetical protein